MRDSHPELLRSIDLTDSDSASLLNETGRLAYVFISGGRRGIFQLIQTIPDGIGLDELVAVLTEATQAATDEVIRSGENALLVEAYVQPSETLVKYRLDHGAFRKVLPPDWESIAEIGDSVIAASR